jgi:Short C-terminal domain/Phospholipase_D-nuclease N-terminal
MDDGNHPLGMMSDTDRGWSMALQSASGRSCPMLLASEWGTGEVFWSMLWFFVFFLWIWLLIVVFGDIFRSPDLSGWGKALWSIFVIVLPYLGVFVYLIARGHKMSEHAATAARQQDAAFREYVQQAAAPSAADELTKLADLKARGVIDDAEYDRLKAKAMA